MIVTPLAEVQPRPRRVAVGTFDGVHLGHREVIRGADTVLTFDPHPSMVVAPGGAPKLCWGRPSKPSCASWISTPSPAVRGPGLCTVKRRTP